SVAAWPAHPGWPGLGQTRDRPHLVPAVDGGGTWIDGEPGFVPLRAEVQRLMRRARRRPWLVIGLAALIAMAAIVLSLRVRHHYRARIAVRVTEVVDPTLARSQWTEQELRGYVNAAALT